MNNKKVVNPEDHMGLVALMTNKLYRKYSSRIAYEDFQQVLSLGLVDSCKRFKPELGFAFSTFACRVMHVAVLKYLRHDGLSVAKLHDKPKSHNISTFTDVFTNSYGENKNHDSLEILADRNEMENFEDRLILKEALRELNPKHRMVIIDLFYHEKTQVELGAKYGVSQVEISRRKTQALQQLKKLLTAWGGGGILQIKELDEFKKYCKDNGVKFTVGELEEFYLKKSNKRLSIRTAAVLKRCS